MSEIVPFTRYGLLRVPGADDMISCFLRRYGEWSFLETDFVRRMLPTGARVLDGGAFVGTFSLGMMGCAPTRIVAIEASGLVHPMLVENLTRNCHTSFDAPHVVMGLPGESCRVPTQSPRDNLGASSFLASKDTEGVTTDDANAPAVTSLADIRLCYGEFDLIKLDIEGAELQVLQSDAEWLRQHRPLLWVECNESPRSLQLFRLIAGLGYEVYYMAYPSHNPDNFRHESEPMFPVAYEAGLLAVPPGREVTLSDLHRLRGCELIQVRDSEHLRQCLWVTPRWGLKLWMDLPASRLLAICSHLHRKESFDEFLKPI